MKRRTDDGFTLIELLVVVCILGVVFLAISAMFSTVLVAHREAERRVGDAQDEQNIAAFFGDDVQGSDSSPVVNSGDIVVQFTIVDFDPVSHEMCNAVSPSTCKIVTYRWVSNKLVRETVGSSRVLVSSSIVRPVFSTPIPPATGPWSLTIEGKDGQSRIVESNRRVS